MSARGVWRGAGSNVPGCCVWRVVLIVFCVVAEL